jgi:hypothetical protein
MQPATIDAIEQKERERERERDDWTSSYTAMLNREARIKPLE